MTQGSEVSWSTVSSFRTEFGERFGPLHSLPIVEFAKEQRALIQTASAVLDFGAGADQPLRKLVEPPARYWSLDVDPLAEPDFRALTEVPADVRFDLVVANQVLEHVDPATAKEIVTGILHVLVPGGRFAATVPNASHPVRQWGDATHMTAWPAEDLYGLFRQAGFDVERLSRYGKRRLSRRPLRRLMVRAIAQEFRVDWCDSLMIVGSRA